MVASCVLVFFDLVEADEVEAAVALAADGADAVFTGVAPNLRPFVLSDLVLEDDHLKAHGWLVDVIVQGQGCTGAQRPIDMTDEQFHVGWQRGRRSIDAHIDRVDLPVRTDEDTLDKEVLGAFPGWTATFAGKDRVDRLTQGGLHLPALVVQPGAVALEAVALVLGQLMHGGVDL